MIEDRLTRDLVIRTPTTQTSLYNDTEGTGWVDVSVKGWLAQQERTEEYQQRDTDVSLWVGMFLPDAVISSKCHVKDEADNEYEVVGNPNPCWRPSGLHHIEATLRLVQEAL